MHKLSESDKLFCTVRLRLVPINHVVCESMTSSNVNVDVTMPLCNSVTLKPECRNIYIDIAGLIYCLPWVSLSIFFISLPESLPIGQVRMKCTCLARKSTCPGRPGALSDFRFVPIPQEHDTESITYPERHP